MGLGMYYHLFSIKENLNYHYELSHLYCKYRGMGVWVYRAETTHQNRPNDPSENLAKTTQAEMTQPKRLMSEPTHGRNLFILPTHNFMLKTFVYLVLQCIRKDMFSCLFQCGQCFKKSLYSRGANHG